VIGGVRDLESRQRIGLYGSGEVPRSRKLWSRAPGPESLGLKDIRQLPPIRRVKPVGNRRKTIAASLIVTLAAAFVIVAAAALVPSASSVPADDEQAPITPYPVIGIVLGNTGTPVPGALINITNTRTHQYNNTIVSESAAGSEGYYIFDLNTLGIAEPADVVTIEAVSLSLLLAGSNSTVVPTVFAGFIWFNVTLTAVIPEFGDVVVPVVGMLSMFIIVVLVARVKPDRTNPFPNLCFLDFTAWRSHARRVTLPAGVQSSSSSLSGSPVYFSATIVIMSSCSDVNR
jgi:hypothetical protein